MSTPASFLEDHLDAWVKESYSREHMAERDLLFHDTLAPHLAACAHRRDLSQPSTHSIHNP